MDLFGPMPDNRHILVAQDMVSRFPAAKILTKTDTAHVTDALREFYTASVSYTHLTLPTILLV